MAESLSGIPDSPSVVGRLRWYVGEAKARNTYIYMLPEDGEAILALVEAAKDAECFQPDESIEGAYRCGECDGCRIRAAIEALNG